MSVSVIAKLTITTTKTTSPAIQTDAPPKLTTISPEIVDELKDFLDLIPTPVVDEIIAEHYIIDGNFRKALKYLRSDEFPKLVQQVQQIPEIIEILEFLHLTNASDDNVVASTKQQSDTNNFAENQLQKKSTTTTINEHTQLAAENGKASLSNTIGAQTTMEIVLLNIEADRMDGLLPNTHRLLPRLRQRLRLRDEWPGPEARHGLWPRLNYYEFRTFSSFVEELLRHLPRDRYVQMINEKRQQNEDFAIFYTALRSPKLRPMVEQAMKSMNLSKVIATLNANDIDVKTLEPIAFDVISWGPNV